MSTHEPSGPIQREPRHAVQVSARLRGPAGWCDAIILNLSNHGLMFRCTEPLERGHYLEIRRGNHVIVARVVWSERGKCGARAQGVIPLADLILDKAAPRRRLLAIDRRTNPRSGRVRHDRSLFRARGTEHLVAAIAGAAVAITLAGTVLSTLARPMATVEAAIASR
jgi:hypothetical protein